MTNTENDVRSPSTATWHCHIVSHKQTRCKNTLQDLRDNTPTHAPAHTLLFLFSFHFTKKKEKCCVCVCLWQSDIFSSLTTHYLYLTFVCVFKLRLLSLFVNGFSSLPLTPGWSLTCSCHVSHLVWFAHYLPLVSFDFYYYQSDFRFSTRYT